MMPEKKRIFIIDDDEVAFLSLKKLLILSEFEVEGTRDPKEALQRIKSFNPHLIILDLIMPSLGGLDICDMLNKDPHTQGIPVIIVSGISNEGDIKKAYHLGVIHYISKPYEFTHLLREVQKSLSYKDHGS